MATPWSAETPIVAPPSAPRAPPHRSAGGAAAPAARRTGHAGPVCAPPADDPGPGTGPGLTAGDRIRNVLGTYCERIDAGDFAGVGALFEHGALAGPEGPPFARGAAEIAAFYEGSVILHGPTPRTKHLVTNVILGEPAGDGTVEVRSSYLVHQFLEGSAPVPLITGRYVDTFAPGGPAGPHDWHLVLRRFHVDLVGDLSHHLHDRREPWSARPGAPDPGS